jgi:hypothetical protein
LKKRKAKDLILYGNAMNLYSGIVKLRYGDQAHKALIGGYLGSEIDEDRSKLR